jgi:hypothetical protein
MQANVVAGQAAIAAQAAIAGAISGAAASTGSADEVASDSDEIMRTPFEPGTSTNANRIDPTAAPPIVPNVDFNFGTEAKQAITTAVGAVTLAGKKLFIDGFDFKIGRFEGNFVFGGNGLVDPTLMETRGDKVFTMSSDLVSNHRGMGGMDAMKTLLPGNDPWAVPAGVLLFKLRF